MLNIFVFLFFYKVTLVTIHKYSQTGCKESQFYSLPEWQAVASMSSLKVVSIRPKKI